MSTDLQTMEPIGLLAMLDSVPDVAAELNAEMGTTSGVQFKFDGRTGMYTLDGVQVPNDTEIAFNFLGTRKGKICYKGGTVVERYDEPVFGGKPLPLDTDLADHGPYEDGEGWSTSITFPVKFLHNGSQSTLRFSSWGGRQAGTKLFEKWAVEARTKFDADGQPLVPLVKIGCDKKQGKVGPYFVPVLTISEWLSVADLKAEIEGDVAEAAPAPAPKAAAPKAPAPAPRAVAGGGLGSGLRGRRA